MRRLQIFALGSICTISILAAAEAKKPQTAAEQQAIQFERAKLAKAQQEMTKPAAPSRVGKPTEPPRKTSSVAAEQEAARFEKAKLAKSQAEVHKQTLFARAR